MKTLKTRIEKLETRKTNDRFIIVFNDWVYIDGEKIPKSEYTPEPGGKVINLDWGENERTNRTAK